MPSWPLQWGGGPEPTEQMVEALEIAVGKGHRAEDSETAEAAWREARAEGLAKVAGLADRAAFQMYPDSAADLSFFRRLFGIPDSDTDQQARDQADELELAIDRGVLPEVLAHLKELDSRFRIFTVPYEQTVTTQRGRTLEPLDGTAPFNIGRRETQWPNYSDAFDVAFALVLDDGQAPGDLERRVLGTARAYLSGAIPAWMNWYLLTRVGFSTGLSLLDLTAPDVTP